MKKILIPSLTLTIIIILCSFSLADKITDYNGTITINNDNGRFDAEMSNLLTVTFNEPEEPARRGGGGGGAFDKTDYSTGTEESIPILNLEELLSTVQPSDLGFDVLPIEKMKAEILNTITANTRVDSESIAGWKGQLPSETEKHLSELTSLLEEGNAGVLSTEHKMELFLIKTIYSNNPASTYRTRVSIKITAPKELSNIKVIELIPKSAADKASELIFIGDKPNILVEDPLLEWNIPFMRSGESRTMTFYIKGKVEQDEFKTVTLYDETKFEPQMPPTGSVVEEPLLEEDNEFPDEESPETKKKVSVWTFIIPLLVLILLAGMVFGGSYIYNKKGKDPRKGVAEPAAASGSTTFVQGQKSLMIRPELIIPYDKVRSVEHFIEEKLRQGIPDQEIRRELISSGWDDHAVDVIVHDVHVIDNNLDKLDSFIQTCFDKGMTADGVKQTLMNVGWREDVVDLALEDFKG